MSKFSIIITFIKTSKLLEENIHSLEKQTFKEFELILISENVISKEFISKFSIKNINTILTNFITPGEKRHNATKYAKGSYLLFLDDDAYANEKLLENYQKYIEKFKFKVMGGPAIDRLDEKKVVIKALSFLYKVKFFGGFPERYTKLKYRTLDDWPSVNFLVKKEIYNLTKGFNYKFWPGEDSLLCNEINYNLNEKIHYIPEAFVFHKRRPTIKSHIKQISNYANMRGKFFSKNIENSSSKKFLVPSAFLIFNFILVISFIVDFSNVINNGIIFIILSYFFLNMIFSLNTSIKLNEKIYFLPIFILANYFNHLIYGFFFLIGFFKEKFK